MRRGDFRLSMRWQANRLVEASLRAIRGGPCIVRYGKRRVSLRTRAGKVPGEDTVQTTGSDSRWQTVKNCSMGDARSLALA